MLPQIRFFLFLQNKPNHHHQVYLSTTSSYLWRPGTAVEADVVEGGVVQAVLVLLHLGLDAADPSVAALLAPAAVLSPGGAGPLQRGVAAAAELDVVDGRVVAEQTLVGLHADLEGGEHARGAVHGVGPLTEAGENRGKRVNEGGMWRRSRMWAGNT